MAAALSRTANGWESVRNWDAPPTTPPPSATEHLRRAVGDPSDCSEEEAEDWLRFPAVKSPTVSRWAGLGAGQAEIGENFLLMAQYDKPRPMRQLLAPVPSPGVARCAKLCAGLGLVTACFQLLAVYVDSVWLGSHIYVTPIVLLGVLLFLCCGTVSVMPDPGITVNFRMPGDSVTALHVAAQHGSMSVARMLVAEGAALELSDVDGRTPLHHAAVHMQTEVAEFLLERGSNIDAEDVWGKRPYQLVPGRGDQLRVALGGPEIMYEYDPDDKSVPGEIGAAAVDGKPTMPPKQTVADEFLAELDRLGASQRSRENSREAIERGNSGQGLSARIRGGTAEPDVQETKDESRHQGDGCSDSARVVCAAERALIRPGAAFEGDARNANGDDPVPEDEDSQFAAKWVDEGGSGLCTSSSDGSSSDEEWEFELEEPPIEALRPSVFSSTDSSSAAQPAVEGVELPPGYVTGGSIGPLAAASSGALDLLQQQYAREPNSLRRCDLSGRSCMVTALENGHIDIVEWLCDLPSESSADSSAAEVSRNGMMDIRSWMIEESGIDSLRPLHHAVLRRDPRAVEALLQAGADTESRTRLSSRYTDGSIDGGVEKVTQDGEREALSDADKTALLLAVTVACHQAALATAAEASGGPNFDPARIVGETRACRAIIRLLLEFGADIHARDQELYTSLHIAQEANVLPLIELLLEHGARTVYEPVEGAVVETSLCWAARQRHTAQVTMLLRHGASVNTPGRGGMTPLHFAARAGNLDIACALLDAGADPAITWRGKTAEELARSNKHDDVATLLRSA